MNWLRREILLWRGGRLADKVIRLVEANELEEAEAIERRELNPIQRTLGVQESRYASTCRCWNEGEWGRVHREDCPIHRRKP
jgi:hypothetical protein